MGAVSRWRGRRANWQALLEPQRHRERRTGVADVLGLRRAILDLTTVIDLKDLEEERTCSSSITARRGAGAVGLGGGRRQAVTVDHRPGRRRPPPSAIRGAVGCRRSRCPRPRHLAAAGRISISMAWAGRSARRRRLRARNGRVRSRSGRRCGGVGGFGAAGQRQAQAADAAGMRGLLDGAAGDRGLALRWRDAVGQTGQAHRPRRHSRCRRRCRWAGAAAAMNQAIRNAGITLGRCNTYLDRGRHQRRERHPRRAP